MIFPPRLDLTRVPTPLEPLDCRRAGVSPADPDVLWIKRDDLTGSILSGNKVRRLEFVVAEALDQGCDTLITCGGIQSNHARATAIVAAMRGLKCVLLLRKRPGDIDDPPDGNLLLDRLMGADIMWITPEEYSQQRNELMEADAEHATLAEDIAARYITSPHLQAQTREVTLRRMELLYDVWTIED